MLTEVVKLYLFMKLPQIERKTPKLLINIGFIHKTSIFNVMFSYIEQKN